MTRERLEGMRDRIIPWITHKVKGISLPNYSELDREKVREELEELFDLAIKALEQEPRKGYWILADSQDNVDVENGNNRYICSECTFCDIHAKSTEVPYCWHCGADMRGEE